MFLIHVFSDFTTGIQSQNTASQSSETGVPFSTAVENFCINFDPSQGSKEFNSKGKQWNQARYLKSFGAYLRFKTAGGGHSCFCPLCFTRNVEVKLIAHLNDHHCNGPENFNQEDLCNDCLTPVKKSMRQKHQKVCFKRYFKDLLRVLLREIDNGRNAFEVWNQLIQSRDD
uniref:Uncharacterized protein n=1 Tax=Panagrolaimus davidi TaxID=227884 RepID=A0A914PYV9_9BILA